MHLCIFWDLWLDGFLSKNFFQFKKPEHLDELFFLLWLGVILGGRIGYILLYNFSYYISEPLKIFAIWEGWMSFHGGLLGVILATYYFSKKFDYKFWNVIDILAVITPVGLAFGRFGNYLNNELYGFADYSGPFAMRVQGIPHFPSPLLELLLEGVVLFVILLFIFFKTNLKNSPGKISGIFLLWYGIARIISEFFRLPDSQIWYIFGTDFITIGMIYTLIMIVFWIYFLMRKN